ncbi:hypothetical protein [Micromonospora sediminimaris]|uniref:Uncharacterized protein n=1 Tax=Micromonospora sediminimaris TaxID=547162 RepID=A0A9W5UU62_9ACTN|nr:hypothetical protein [Micromonospora sediminimaris]GIJ34438.1 hypothetical protein Vse01_35860 [Micromonospora sediminimaris]SFD30130.1 hypothetical protein SAMN05216284_114162 [Micromonospora sediminimaris]
MNVYPFIEAEQAGKHNVKRACELLKVSRSAYYQHARGEQSARDRVDDQLSEQIIAVPLGRRFSLQVVPWFSAPAKASTVATAVTGWLPTSPPLEQELDDCSCW